MEYYISQIIQGMANGCVYGLIGLSMMFIYRSTRVFNFAQGELATATTFFTFSMLKIMNPWLAVTVSLGTTIFVGAILGSTMINFFKSKSELTMVIVTIGFLTIINSLDSWVYGYDPMAFPSPIPDGSVAMSGVILSYRSIWLFGCTIFLSCLLYVVFKYTLLGIAFQAISEDSIATRLKGVRVGPLIAMGWGISALISGIAGLLVAPSAFLHPNMMTAPLLFAFAAAVIGGLQSSFGALVGGMIIGVTENLAGASSTFGSELKIVPVFLMMLVFLMIRPRGLFGRHEPRRV